MVHFIRTLILVLSTATLSLAASSWSFSDATIAVGPKGKEATSLRTFTAKSPVDETLEFVTGDTLRIAFTTKEGASAARPHQSFILIEDPSTNLEISVAVPVKPSGKAKLDLDQKDLPPQLIYAERLKLSLVIASFGDATPLKMEVATLTPVTNEASPPKPSPPERWGPKPEITHTFREPQKSPNKGLSALFVVAVMAGIPLLFILLIAADANLDSAQVAFQKAPIAHLGFFASLIVFEMRFYRYWLDGTLGKILVESSGIAIVAFLTGRRALSEVMQRRALKQ